MGQKVSDSFLEIATTIHSYRSTAMKLVSASRFVGFDASVYVSPNYAGLLYSMGYRLAIRYIRRDSYVTEAPDLSGGSVSLSKRERDELLATGFDISPVQFASLSLVPSTATGTQAGTAAANNAKSLGFLPGSTVWCDLEWSTVPAAGAQAIMDYVNAWAAAVTAAGYVAGVYVGPNCGLTGAQLYSFPKVKCYWKSASIVPWVETRGFQMIQGLPITLGRTSYQNGIEIDQDIVCLDNKGEVFKCMAA